MRNLFTENWLVSFLITVLTSYLLLRTLFKANTVRKNKFIITYVIVVIIFDVILFLNKEKVSGELFKGLSIGLFMGIVFAVLRKNKTPDD